MVWKCDSSFLERGLIMRFDLSDEERAVMEPLLPKGGRVRKRVNAHRAYPAIPVLLS